jgi:hypothetical protein
MGRAERNMLHKDGVKRPISNFWVKQGMVVTIQMLFGRSMLMKSKNGT